MLDQLEYGKHIGEFNTDGSIKADVSHCALSGRFLRSIHSTRYRLAGTPYFYRVLTDAAPRGLSDAQRTALDEQVQVTIQVAQNAAAEAEAAAAKKTAKAPASGADDNQE